jgi:hypothetical protein
MALDLPIDWHSAENLPLYDLEFFNRIGQKQTPAALCGVTFSVHKVSATSDPIH